MLRIESFSLEQTREVAKSMGQKAQSGQIICLCGDLGTGKTAFSKGFGEGLGVADDIVSPTFGLVHVYEGRLSLYHFDVYRIHSVSEMEDTGYEDYFYGDGVCLVEWADLVRDIIPESAIWVRIRKDYSKGDDYRLIEIEGRE